MRVLLSFLLFFLGYKTSSQTVSSSWGPFYLPNTTAQTAIVTFGGLDGDTSFFMNIEVDGDYWFGIGFSESAFTPGTMQGTDAWIYGDYGDGYPGDIFEWNLGAGTLGTQDVIDNLYNTAATSFQQYHSIHLERALNTGDKTDYIITLAGELCFIYAIGISYDITSGHGLGPNKGEFCVTLGGTTQPPSPAPTFWPTPAPTETPTTASPTQPGDTLSPSKSPTTPAPTALIPVPTANPTQRPTNRPTDRFTTAAPSRMPTRNPTENGFVPSEEEEDTKKSKGSKTNWFMIYTILTIVGIVCCICCVGGALWRERQRRKARKEKMQEKRKNLIEAEKIKQDRGLVQVGVVPSSYHDDDDDEDDDDYPDTDVNSDHDMMSDQDDDVHSDDDNNDNEDNDYNADLYTDNTDKKGESDPNKLSIKTHQQLHSTSNIDTEIEIRDDYNDENTHEPRSKNRNKHKKSRNKSKKRSKSKKKKNRRDRNRDRDRDDRNDRNRRGNSRKRRNNKSRRDRDREERYGNDNNSDNDVRNNSDNENDSKNDYKKKLEELKKKRAQKRKNNKFRNNRRRGKFGGDDF